MCYYSYMNPELFVWGYSTSARSICFSSLRVLIPNLKILQYLNFMVKTKPANNHAEIFSNFLLRSNIEPAYIEWESTHPKKKVVPSALELVRFSFLLTYFVTVLITVCLVSSCFSRVSLSFFFSFFYFFSPRTSPFTCPFSLTGQVATCVGLHCC